MARRIPKRFLEEIKEFPGNVPKRLVREYKRIVKEHKGKGGYQRKLAGRLEINIKYLSDLFLHGVEPTDRTEKGRCVRAALFLPKKKKVSRAPRTLREVPEFLKQWNRLPKEERHKIIQQYLEWRSMK